MNDSLTRGLLAPVVAWLPDDADEATLRAIRTLLLDHIGVAAWGSTSEVATIMRTHARDDLGRDGAPVMPIIGTDENCSAVEAAMANAVAAACYEFDDTHTGGSAHPGSVIFPAAMASAVLAGCDEKRFFAAVYAGYEVMCRLARAVNPHAHRARHFHPTATTGHFGSAAAAAVCLGLDLDQAVAALALAGTVAGGSMQFLVEGAITKQLHPAYAVQRGVQAALLAGRGFPGLDDPIGGTRGFLTAQSEDPKPERLLAGLGTDPAEVTRTGIKPYPSCRNTQSAVGALLALLAEHPVRADEVESMTVGLIRPGLATVWEPREHTRRPKTLADAQFSMPYVAAVTVIDGRLGTAQFDESRYADTAVCALMDRVDCVGDPALDARYPSSWPAWVLIRTRAGQLLRGAAEHPKGDPTNPLTDEELLAKFTDLTRLCYADQQRSALVDAVAAMPEPGSFARILDAAAGQTVASAKRTAVHIANN
jgi:2-methylcitrate dehydratase PrpD